MAINTLATATIFQTTLDQIAVQEAKTGWMDANSGQVVYNGGAEVKVPKISLDGLADYDRDKGYTQGSVTLEYETLKMTQDRGRKFQLGGILIYIATMIFCFKGWKQWEKESEEIGYPEGAGLGIAAACTFFIGCMLFAIFWPALPFIVIGILICDDVQSRKEKMRGDDEDGSENWPCEH